MKKSNAAKRRRTVKASTVTTVDSVPPLQALHFLEDMRVLYSTKDEPTKPISLRLPANLLRLLKTRAATEGKKYQSLMIEILRDSFKGQ